MNVVIPILRYPMMDRSPPTRIPRTLLVIELHQRNEVLSNLLPFTIRKPPFLRTQRQRAMPHMPARNIHAIALVRDIQMPRDRQPRSPVQHVVVIPRQQSPITSNKMRLSVLVRPPWTNQIPHQPRHPIPTHNVRHHRRSHPVDYVSNSPQLVSQAVQHVRQPRMNLS